MRNMGVQGTLPGKNVQDEEMGHAIDRRDKREQRPSSLCVCARDVGQQRK